MQNDVLELRDACMKGEASWSMSCENVIALLLVCVRVES